MTTLGLVTVMSGDRVVMKIVTGCHGRNAKKFAIMLKAIWPIGINKVYALAKEMRFGCLGCLVVISNTKTKHWNHFKISPLYRETFQKPAFNPRWKIGANVYVEFVNV